MKQDSHRRSNLLVDVKRPSKLRASIREQRKKNWQFGIYIITALTSLGGTIIGIHFGI